MAYDKGSINKVILIGRLGSEPETKYVPSGAAVCSVSLATTTSWKKDGGEEQVQTEWHRVVAWRKLAEILGQYAKKGSKLYVEGRLATREWQDKDGVKRYTTEVIAETVQLLDKREQSDEGKGSTSEQAQSNIEILDDDDGSLPF